jgi:hypothetical protein
MQRVFRSTFVGVLALAALTACGDKNATTPGQVTGITVTPTSANINIGDRFTFVANVTATGTAARTVTWSTGDATIATVDQNGVVTGVKGGNTSVIATSTVDASVRGAASVSVGVSTPPTVTIASINHTIPGTGSVPVDQSNVQGQIDVLVNLDAGTQKVSSVSLIMSCGGKDTTVQTQTISTGDIAPLGADASASTIPFSFNTGAFNPATGAVAFKNGVCTLKASAVTSSGTVVASLGEQLTLNNADNISVTSITTTPSAGQVASANDAAGLVWHAGAVNVTAVPVIFSTGTIASAAISLVNVSGASALGQAAATIANNTPIATISGIVPASGALTATFPNSPTAASGVGGATVNGLGVTVTTVNSTGNNGPILTATSALATPANTIRLDNLAPDVATTPPLFNPNTQNSQNGWVGKNFAFSVAAGSLTLGSAATDVTAGIAGVDNVVDTTQFAVGASTTFTNFTAVSSLAETSSGSTNTLRLKICDALGNCKNVVPNNSVTLAAATFGVDLTPPTLTFNSGFKDGQVFQIGTAFPATISYGVSDTSNTPGVTASGAAANDLLVSVQGLHPSGAAASATTCDIGTQTGTAPAQSCKAPAPEPGSFAPPAAITVAGEYTFTVTAVDQAGNQSAAQALRYYVDQAAPVVAGGVAVPASITTGTSFASTATDNMDVAAGNGFLQYPTSAGLSVQYHFVESGTATPTGVTFDNALVRSSAINLTLNTFYRSLSNVLGTVGSAPNSAGVRALDAAGNVAVNQAVALPATNISAGAAISNTSTTNGITSWAVTAVPTTVDSLKATVLTATAQAINATSASPFTQVCFYYQAPSGIEGGAAGPGGSVANELVLIGCTASETTTLDNAVPPNRFLNYSISWTPPLSFPNLAAANVFAVGSTGAGLDGQITAPLVVTVNK